MENSCPALQKVKLRAKEHLWNKKIDSSVLNISFASKGMKEQGHHFASGIPQPDNKSFQINWLKSTCVWACELAI